MKNKELLEKLEMKRREMQSAAGYSNYYDPEGGHMTADSILKEVIELLATAHYGTTPRVVRAILKEYNRVYKWYA